MTTEPLDLDELVEYWTLLDGDRELVAGKRGGGRLASALMLKFYARHGCFPDSDGDLPGEVVEFVARQGQAPPEEMPGYELDREARSGPRRRAARRLVLGCDAQSARGLAPARHGRVPVASARASTGAASDAACGAVVDAGAGDHRHAR
jgi:hypothetical protein